MVKFKDLKPGALFKDTNIPGDIFVFVKINHKEALCIATSIDNDDDDPKNYTARSCVGGVTEIESPSFETEIFDADFYNESGECIARTWNHPIGVNND